MKRLYKGQNQVVCGVCSGIADYLGLDATIIRIIWAIFIFAGGTGIGLYLICAFLMPEYPGYIETSEDDYTVIEEYDDDTMQ